MDVLEVGAHDRPPRRRTRAATRIVIVAAVGVLAIVIGAAAIPWWAQQSARPDRLEVVALEAIGPFAISGADLPEGWPRGLVAGALRLRAEVTGDPQRTLRVTSSGEGDAYVAGGVEVVTVPAGESADIDVIVTPSDCGALDPPSHSPLVDASGAPVPVSATARGQLRDALLSLCAPGGTAPALTAAEARIDVFFRDRTLVVNALLTSAADRSVLQPRDGTALRGLQTQEVETADDLASVQLRWLISPGEMTPQASLVGRVRAFSIVAGRAYPWLLTVAVPRNYTITTAPSAPARNDGVDLAEVAPRPAG
jgi:hypothetical protein